MSSPEIRQVKVFDTTLRDGSQAPGVQFTHDDKIAIAHKLADIGVDVIEAGFPNSSMANFATVHQVATEVVGPVICGFARGLDADIERAAEALEPATVRSQSRLHVVVPASDQHLSQRLKITREDALRRTVASVHRARNFTNDVQFCAEVAAGADRTFLSTMILLAASSGASTIMVPDTLGTDMPDEYAALIAFSREQLDKHGFGAVVVSAHCHNDLGFGLANAIAGVRAGADQVEVTVGELGERAGNTGLESVAGVMHTREDLNLRTKIRTESLKLLVDDVMQRSGLILQPHRPFTGKHAFTHASGMHQNGVIENPELFESVRARDYGQEPGQLYLNDQSGSAGFKSRLRHLNASELSDEQLRKLTENAKALRANEGRDLADSDVERLAAELTHEVLVDKVLVTSFEYTAGTDGMSSATVRVGDQSTTVSSQEGTVDAACRAIDYLTGFDANIKEWTGSTKEAGSNADVGIFVHVECDGYHVKSYAHSKDTERASVAAYQQALNMILRAKARKQGKINV